MPIFEITSPSGKRYEITAPEGATKLQAMEYAKRQFSEQENSIKEHSNPVINSARNNGFLKGYMDQASGIAQILSRLSPDSRTPEMVLSGMPSASESIDSAISNEEEAYSGPDGIDWARMAGNLFNPVGLIGGAAAIPKGVVTKIAAGSALGAAEGGAMPVSGEGDFATKKGYQVSTGAAIGGMVPSAVASVRGAWDLKKYLTRPFSESGRLKDLQELFVGLAGESRDRLVSLLDNAKTYNASSKPTAGQAIAEGSLLHGDDVGGAIVRLEKDLSRKGVTGDKLKSIYAGQERARKGAIDGVIDSTDEGLNAAKAFREAETVPLYDAVKASNAKVRTEHVVATINRIIKENKNQDNITAPLNDILTKLHVDDALDTNPGNLYSLSKHIKGLIARKTPGGQNEFDVSALSVVKKKLDDSIGRAEPLYKEVQGRYKELSRPINQIQVIRELGDALKNSAEQESATPFLNAIKNSPRTIKKSTGFPRYEKLDQVLNGEQIRIVNNTKKELVRQAKANKMSAHTEGVFNELKEGIEPNLPNLLSRPALIANAVLKRIGKDMGPAYERLASDIVSDPKKLADILRKPKTSRQRKMVAELLERQAAMIPARDLSLEIGD